MLEVFNTPASDFSCERRESSTVTPQALNLFNSKNSYDRSLALAQRAWSDIDKDADNRDELALRRIYELVLCRQPEHHELEQVLQSLNPGDRAILLMKYQDGEQIKNIAEQFGKSESAIKMQIKRAKERARKIRAQQFPDELNTDIYERQQAQSLRGNAG